MLDVLCVEEVTHSFPFIAIDSTITSLNSIFNIYSMCVVIRRFIFYVFCYLIVIIFLQCFDNIHFESKICLEIKSLYLPR